MYLVLIAGLPATGKSGFAEYAGKALGLPLICKDSIKEILFDRVGFKSHEEKTRLNYASFDIMLYAARQMLLRGDSVALENNFEHYTEGPLRELIAASGCTPITVRFGGDVAVIYQRYVARNADPRRHRGHVLSDRYPETENIGHIPPPISFERFRDDFRARGMSDFDVGGDCIDVDTTDFSKVDYDAILGQVRALMGKGDGL